MSTTPKPDHRTLPRKKRAPSGRDQAIFVERHVRGCSQEALAKDHGLSQRRISQILQRVEKWRANLRPQAEGELNHAERQRLERWLARERNQAIYDRAIRAFDTAPQELKTVREGERGETKFSEETRREQPVSAQLLKVAQRASEDLAKAADKPAPPPARDPQAEQQQAWQQMRNLLCDLRREAEEAGKVAVSHAHQGDNYSYMNTVESWLDALLGEKPEWIGEVHLLPGTPLDELTRWFDELKRKHAARAAGAVADAASVGGRLDNDAGSVAYERVSNSSNASNLDSDEVSQVPECEPVAAESPPQKIVRSTPEPSLVPAKDDLLARRQRHFEKLEQLKIARRRGLPIMFEFDPADGPLPPPYYSLDGAECE